MKIHIPMEICDRLGIDRCTYVSSDKKSSLAVLVKEANKQLEMIASSTYGKISRSIYIQRLKEDCLPFLK